MDEICIFISICAALSIFVLKQPPFNNHGVPQGSVFGPLHEQYYHFYVDKYPFLCRCMKVAPCLDHSRPLMFICLYVMMCHINIFTLPLYVRPYVTSNHTKPSVCCLFCTFCITRCNEQCSWQGALAGIKTLVLQLFFTFV